MDTAAANTLRDNLTRLGRDYGVGLLTATEYINECSEYVLRAIEQRTAKPTSYDSDLTGGIDRAV